jgi:DeoR family transcriptional regulator of aga operon
VRGLTTARQGRIIELLRENGFVRNSELSSLLGVSTVTIRQDVETLQSLGVVRKMFGGAVLQAEGVPDSVFAQRAQVHREEKQRIGAAAARLIQPGETILLDAGTTTVEIAKRLPEHADLTVLTAALNVALEAGARAGVSVIVCGGDLNPRTLSAVGYHVEHMLRDVNADRLFLATYAVDLNRGLAERNFAGAQIKRKLIAAARQVMLVCDSSKFGETAPVLFAPLDLVHYVVTDQGITDQVRDFFQEKQIPVEAV